jgi:histidinol-phosphate aminotransferase
LTEFHNLVILQTLSKAWGMAGIRLGMAFASAQIIQILNRIKYPYNVNSLSQEFALNRLSKEEDKVQWVKMILEQRKKLSLKLMENKLVEEILPSDANFLMVRFKNPKQIFRYLTGEKIIVRDRSAVPLCEGCLRFTIGTDKENEALLKALQDYNM